MVTLHFDGYTAEITHIPETNSYKGVIIGLRGASDFVGKDREELEREFQRVIREYLCRCRREGIPLPPHGENSLRS